jgi:DNA-binding response OmpR family regulator
VLILEKKRILFADDDPEIREALCLLLNSEGYETVQACCGQEVLERIDPTFDLVILDVMMPEMNGFEVCEELRKRYTIPILFLTAKASDHDKAIGFSAGGDDYLVKPFSYNELLNRIKAILRRYYVYGAKSDDTTSVIRCCGNVEIHTRQCMVKVDGEEVILTDLEYRILLLLASNPKRIYSTQSIYETVWNEPYTYSSNNNVMVHIRNIRRKLGDDPQNSHTIRTVWGKGYRIE